MIAILLAALQLGAADSGRTIAFIPLER